MGYIFEEIERKVYPKTFLKDVHIGLDFNGSMPDRQSAADFFENNFKLSLDADSEYSSVTVNSEDGLIKFDFSLTHIELVMRHPAYRKFELALKWVSLMTDYLNLMDVGSVGKLTMSKYNELEYAITDGGPGVETVMRQVFSSDMLTFGGVNAVDEEKNFENMTRWEKFGTFEGHDAWDSLFSFEYGFSKRATDPLRGCLTLKTIIESRNTVLATHELEDTMQSFNYILDRGFHWCVTKEIISKIKE
ncbi:MAG: hypothetical protein J6B33_02690 [Prevotella sp.]|nr:hypothetical protein [Prevotella sp.]